MSWVRIEDLLPHHRKVRAAGRDAEAVLGWHVAAIAFCQRTFSDGMILREDLSVILPGVPLRPKIQQHLERPDPTSGCPLWEPLANGLGWTIHDYFDYNDRAEVRRSKLQMDAARKRGGRPSGVRSESERSPVGIRAESERILSNLPVSNLPVSPSIKSPTGVDTGGQLLRTAASDQDGAGMLSHLGEGTEPVQNDPTEAARLLRERREIARRLQAVPERIDTVGEVLRRAGQRGAKDAELAQESAAGPGRPANLAGLAPPRGTDHAPQPLEAGRSPGSTGAPLAARTGQTA